MTTIHKGFARVCAMFLVSLFCSTAFGAATKVDVCHFPADDLDNFHTIRISEKAWPAHEKHGDVLGGCEVDPFVGCPCFTADDLPPNSTGALCDGTPETEKWVLFNDFASAACSGDGSVSPFGSGIECTGNSTPEALGCALNDFIVDGITADENAACLQLISIPCP